MRSRMRRQNSPGHPASIEIARRALDEATDIVTPVSEARQPERQAAAKRSRHCGIGIFRGAAPMNKISLTTGPSVPRTDQILAGCSFRACSNDIVLTQGEDV